MAYRRRKKPWRIFADGVNMGSRNRAAANMDDVPLTQYHGKRGMVRDRATGPDEVAIQRPTERFARPSSEQVSRPTVVPRAVVGKVLEDMRARGTTEWRYVSLRKHPVNGNIFKVYDGFKMFFAKEVGKQYWVSAVYTDTSFAMAMFHANVIDWEGPYPSPLPNQFVTG